MKNLKSITVVLCTLCFSISYFSTIQAAPKESFEVINTIAIEGDDKWDFLFSDDQANRLYVSHGAQVQVIDEQSRKVVGKITGLKGVHGIAIAPTLHKGFISNGKDSSVSIFNTTTLEVTDKIKVTGASPDAILFDSFSKKVFVFNAKSNNATVLDAATNKIESTILFSGNPEVAVSDEKGKIFLNLESSSSVVVINTSSYKVENEWSLKPGLEPTGLAIDKEYKILFSTCANKMMIVMDANTGKCITSLPIGAKTDGAAFDPTLKMAFSSNGDGTLSLIKEESPTSFSLFETVKTQTGAKTIALNQLTHHLYVPTAKFEKKEGEKKPTIVSGSFVVLEVAADK
jgi:YVTN family beta-propeller protein